MKLPALPVAPPASRLARRLGLAASAAAGALGLLPTASGAADPVALLAWLALLAPAAGYACGALGVRFLPYGLAVPGFWAGLVALADFGSARDLATPLWGLAAVAGGFGLGSFLGAWLGRPAAGAGSLLLAALCAVGAPVQGGLSRGESWGASHPRLARALVEASPLVLVLECAGLDWTHAQPDVYRLSGVEWFPRRPYRGPLAGPVVLVLGCVLGGALGRTRDAHVPKEEDAAD